MGKEPVGEMVPTCHSTCPRLWGGLLEPFGSGEGGESRLSGQRPAVALPSSLSTFGRLSLLRHQPVQPRHLGLPLGVP